MTRTPARLLALLGLALFPALASADTVTLKSGLSYDNVTIDRIENGEVFWTSSGGQNHRPLDAIAAVKIATEPNFNAGTAAYDAKEWDKAAEAFNRVAGATNKEWLRTLANTRALDSADKAGRFDLVVDIYLRLLKLDTKAAIQIQLNLPKPDSALVTRAIDRATAAATDASLKAEQKLAVLELLYRLQVHKSNEAGADAVLKQIFVVKPDHPLAREAAVRKVLGDIQKSLEAKKFDEVIGTVEKEQDKFSTPTEQAEALYLIAEARAGKVGAGTDPAAWKDVALAYMRVATAFEPKTPRVADALLKTADILATRLKDKPSAVQLYRQITNEYRDTPEGQKAQEELKELEKAG